MVTGIDSLAQARIDRIELILRGSSFGLSEVLKLVPRFKQKRVLIVIDQFEELFRFADLDNRLGGSSRDAALRRDEATAFVGLLLATKATKMPLRIVITMRSDFIGDCSRYHGLPEAVTASQFLVPGLTRDERAAAICEPVREAGALIDMELVQKALNDTTEDPDQLPILQHLMMRCWQLACEEGVRASKITPTLTGHHYRAVGGAANALSVHATEILTELRERPKSSGIVPLDLVAKRLFQTLTDVDKSGRVVRRPQRLLDLLHCAVGVNASGNDLADSKVRRTVETVVRRFAEPSCSFLRASRVGDRDDSAIIDIGHEALIRRWDLLKGGSAVDWIREEQEDAEQYRGLVRIAKAGATIPPEELAAIEKWWNRAEPNRYWAARYDKTVIGRQGSDHFDNVLELLDRSRRNAALVEEQKRLQKRSESRRRIYRMATAVSILIAVSSGAVVWAQVRKYQAERDAEMARQNANLITAQAKLSSVRVLAFASDRVARPTGANGAGDAVALLLAKPDWLPNVFEYHQALFHSLLELRERRRITELSAQVSSLALSRDKRIVVGAGPSKGKLLLQFWATDTGRFIDSIELDGAGFPNVRWSPRGDRLFIGASPLSYILKPCSRSRLREYFSDACDQLTVDVLQQIGSAQNPAAQGVWSPDGSRILTGGFQREARLWSSADGKLLGVWNANERKFVEDRNAASQPAAGIAFSPDGEQIAIGSSAGEIFIVDAETLAVEKTLVPREPQAATAIFSLAFNPVDPNMLLSVAPRSVLLWDVASGHAESLPNGGATPFQGVFEPRGTFVATSSDDGALRLFPLESGRRSRAPIILRGHRAPTFALDVSETFLISGSNDRTIRFWDRYAPLSPRLTSDVPGVVEATMQQRDGVLFVTKGHSRVAVKLPEGVDEVRGSDISADGKFVLVVPREGAPIIYLKDQSGKELVRLRGPAEKWKSASFTKSDSAIVGVADDGRVYEWAFYSSLDDLRQTAAQKLPHLLTEGGRGPEDIRISPPQEVLCVLFGGEACRASSNSE
jgi:WD40 repeat protein